MVSNPKLRKMRCHLLPCWVSSSLASNERQNSLPKWKLLNMQSIKRGTTRIEISRSADVRLHRVAEKEPFLSCQTDTNPVFRHHHPLPATPAKIGPNSTTVELNSLKFKWEMSFHWSCKYWKWARVENWVNVCAFKSSVVKREVASGFLWPIKDFFASTLNLWNKADGGQISISDGCSA